MYFFKYLIIICFVLVLYSLLPDTALIGNIGIKEGLFLVAFAYLIYQIYKVAKRDFKKK